jgi:hypothetical protein
VIFTESSASSLKRSPADAFCLNELLLVRESRTEVPHGCKGEGVIVAQHSPITIQSGSECELGSGVLLAIQ